VALAHCGLGLGDKFRLGFVVELVSQRCALVRGCIKKRPRVAVFNEDHAPFSGAMKFKQQL
jgi:hypothetical protein